MFLLNIGTAASHVSRCQSVEDKLKKFGGGGGKNCSKICEEKGGKKVGCKKK